MICNSILDAMGNTPIIRLNNITDPDSAEILVKFEGLNVGGVRPPLTEVTEQDDPIVNEAAAMIDAAVKKYL